VICDCRAGDLIRRSERYLENSTDNMSLKKTETEHAVKIKVSEHMQGSKVVRPRGTSGKFGRLYLPCGG
jgi:hypothetical protein